MYSIYIIRNVLNHIQCINNIILVERRAKSCDPKTEIAVLKHNAISILRVLIVFTILYTFWKSMIKYNMYYRPDMGWETGLIWTVNKYGGINKRKISRNIIKLKGALFP